MSASDRWQELDIREEIAEYDQREADRLAGHAPASPKGNDARLVVPLHMRGPVPPTGPRTLPANDEQRPAVTTPDAA
jgi:hypothetical protein